MYKKLGHVEMYNVCIVDDSNVTVKFREMFGTNFFPHKFFSKQLALRVGRCAAKHGCKVRVEFPNGAEFDIAPTIAPTKKKGR